MSYRAVMKNIFGYEGFKSVDQKNAVESILEGKHKNYIVNMETQGGKSLCYQLPGTMKTKGVTVVISPSLALIYDHKNYLNSLGIKAETINGNINLPDRDEIREEIESEGSTTRFLFITPEIINANFIMRGALEEWLEEGIVNYVVIDDAHKAIDSVHYRESFGNLEELRKLNEEIPWIALTTAYPDLPIAQELSMKNPLVLSSSSVRENIFYDSVFDKGEKGNSMIDFFKDLTKKEGKMPSGIIFCGTYEDLESVVKFLRDSGFHSEAYYSSRYKESVENQMKIEKWRNEEFPILVATGESFGFGVIYQIPTIRFVIHIGMPGNLRSFYHESGRAGNDGQIGYSRVYGGSGFSNSLFDHYHHSACKRQFLAKSFGETIDKCINLCNVCLKNSQTN